MQIVRKKLIQIVSSLVRLSLLSINKMKFIQSIEVLIIFTLLFASCAVAWDQDDLEVFDLVEEVNENFYELLKIKQVMWLHVHMWIQIRIKKEF